MQKPRTRQRRSNPSLRKYELEEARVGRNTLSFSVAIRDHLRDAKIPDLPAGKYAFVQEFIAVLNSVTRILESLHPDRECRVVLDRGLADQVVLCAVALYANTQTLEGMVPATDMVEERQRRLIAAAAQLEVLNKKLATPGATFEQYESDYVGLGMADEFKVLLGIAAKEVDAKVIGKNGAIALRNCKREITHLPSTHLHRFKARVRDFSVTPAGFTRVVLVRLDVIEPASSLVGNFHQLVCHFDDRELRNTFLRSAIQDDCVELVAKAVRVPLLNSADDILDIDVVSCKLVPESGR